MLGVEAEKLEAMRKRISQHPYYHRFEGILTDEYLTVVMTQMKKGQVRTFDYSCAKLEDCIDYLSAQDFYSSLKEVPEHLLRNPFFYIGGRDNEGRYVLVYEWARLKPSDWQTSIKHLLPLWTAIFLAVIENSEASQVVVVSMGHNTNLPLRLIPTALRHMRHFIRETVISFPDRVFQQFQFPTKALVPILQFVRRFAPPNSARKLVIGSHSEVREKLAALCDDFEGVLLPELGGNENRSEQHVEFIVREDGSFTSRILSPEESNGHVVVDGSDLEGKFDVGEEKAEVPPSHIQKEVTVAVEEDSKEEDPKEETRENRNWLFSMFRSGEEDEEEKEEEKKSGGREEVAEDIVENEEAGDDASFPAEDSDSEFEELESIVGSFRVQGKGQGTLRASQLLNDRLVLEARRVVFEAGKKKKRKRILKNVDARFVSNELTGKQAHYSTIYYLPMRKDAWYSAIMGPSGAGKSSLLNVLTGSKKLSQGEVLLNGISVTHNIRGSFAFIPQENVLFPGLSPRQSLHYAARLLHPDDVTKKEREELVDSLLERLQLVNCADSLVGDASKRGISGGERKRTSIALDLVSSPRILFVDEPTSGLDSKMAKDVVEIFKEVSREDRLVIVVIHQPSFEVFLKFDTVLLLKLGSVLYTGPTSEFVDYFKQFDWGTIRLQGNPIDQIFEEIQDSDIGPLLRAWNTSPNQEELRKRHHKVEGMTLPPSEANSSAWNQFKVLFSRTLYDTAGDPVKTRQRLIKKVVINLIVGVVFLNLFDRTNATAFVSTSALFLIMFSLMIENMLNGFAQYSLLFPIIVREYRNGAFMVSTYVSAQMICTIGTDIMFGLPAVIAYLMVGFPFEHLPLFLLILCLLAGFGSISGLVIGSLSTDIRDATRYVNIVMLPSIMFSGFLIPFSVIPDYLEWLYYVSYLQYALSTALFYEFQGVVFSDCPVLNTTGCAVCFRTGEEYVAAYGVENPDIVLNILIMAFFLIGLMFGAVFLISRKIITLARQL